MISLPNNIRFRFRDSDKDAQVIINSKDYQKMIKGISKQTMVSAKIAKETLHSALFSHVKNAYGMPSKVTLIIDEAAVVIH